MDKTNFIPFSIKDSTTAPFDSQGGDSNHIFVSNSRSPIKIEAHINFVKKKPQFILFKLRILNKYLH